MASQLDGLATEFDDLTQVADVGSAAGNATLESTLSDFANGWSDKRSQLVKEMQGLAKTANQAVKEYHGTDDTLTSELTKPAHGKAT
jgi:hypothetical protein